MEGPLRRWPARDGRECPPFQLVAAPGFHYHRPALGAVRKIPMEVSEIAHSSDGAGRRGAEWVG